jgi:hypothetical protein
LVRKVPAEDFAVVMTVPPDELAPAGEAAAGEAAGAAALEDDPPAGEAAGAAALLVPPLLHAATTTAAPSAPPTPATSLVRLDTGANVDSRMMLISRPARSNALASHKCLSIDVREKGRKRLLLTTQVDMT